MARETFERGLRELCGQVNQMGEMVNRALKQAVEALRQHQPVLAQHVIDNDVSINRLRFTIEEQALTLIATQAPVAHDLRLIAAIMNITTELERMGDHAKGIARIEELMRGTSPIVSSDDFTKMTQLCTEILQEALAAFVKLDPVTARLVAQRDDELDTLYNKIYLNLLEIMTNDVTKVSHATYLLWVAHNLERYGDRIVNICERVIFVATGEFVEINGSRNG